MLALPAFAQASVLSITGNVLTPETPDQIVTVFISGTDQYVAVDMATSINGGVGPAPFVTHVFGDTNGAISPATLYAGSVWVNGSLGITLPPNGTSFDSSGLTPGGGFQTPGGASITTEGIFAQFTFSTVGVPAGDYVFSFDGTVLNNGLDENFEPIVVELTGAPFLLTVLPIPEPSSIVLGLFAAAGMAAVVVRRRRAA
jgi:hypothetical protein